MQFEIGPCKQVTVCVTPCCECLHMIWFQLWSEGSLEELCLLCGW
jgi:hypothetical protein